MNNASVHKSDFFQQVYQVVRLVPYGRVTTYKAIAVYLGTAQSARMVGWALHQAGSQQPYVPAHRVVNHCGLLSGKAQFPHPEMMQELLENEGVEVDDDKVVRFKELLWEPLKELDEEP
ncbi:MAG: MGMT family protein [Breznakibacter sp.]